MQELNSIDENLDVLPVPVEMNPVKRGLYRVGCVPRGGTVKGSYFRDGVF